MLNNVGVNGKIARAIISKKNECQGSRRSDCGLKVVVIIEFANFK